MATNNLELIGTCANGCKIYNRPISHLHEDVSKEILIDALSKLSPTKRFHVEVVDFHYTIGKNFCVEVDENDEIIYVIRKGRDFPSVMVKNREPHDCSCLTIIFKRISKKNYVLISAFIGDESEPEPWDYTFYNHITWEKSIYFNKKDYQKSVEFWKHHALIYDKSKVSLHLS